MSNRSLIEINHDYWYTLKDDPEGFVMALRLYLGSANKDTAERLERFGIRVFGMRHHSYGFEINWGGIKVSEPESRR